MTKLQIISLISLVTLVGPQSAGTAPAILKSEFIFERSRLPFAHASTIVETAGGLVASWVGGPRERAPEVVIWTSRHDGSWLDSSGRSRQLYSCDPSRFQQTQSGTATNPTNLGADANGNPLRRATKTGHVSNYDESKVRPYTLPDPLVLANGTRVRGAATWRKQRRPEILRRYENRHLRPHSRRRTLRSHGG